MCGLVGYAGYRDAVKVNLMSLERVAYRGYDSAGLAIQNGVGLEIRKVAGRVEDLQDGVAIAYESIASGKAKAALERMAAITNEGAA